MAGFKLKFNKVIAVVEYKNIIDINLPTGSGFTAEERPIITGEGLFFGLGMSF